MTRSTRAFSLFEALCMIVTLCVFGWLCVGVIRHEMKNSGKDEHAGIKFTNSEAEPAKTDADPARPEAKPDEPAAAPAPAKTGSQPAGSPAPAKP